MSTEAAPDSNLVWEDALGGTADHDIELACLDNFHQVLADKALFYKSKEFDVDEIMAMVCPKKNNATAHNMDKRT